MGPFRRGSKRQIRQLIVEARNHQAGGGISPHRDSRTMRSMHIKSEHFIQFEELMDLLRRQRSVLLLQRIRRRRVDAIFNVQPALDYFAEFRISPLLLGRKRIQPRGRRVSPVIKRQAMRAAGRRFWVGEELIGKSETSIPESQIATSTGDRFWPFVSVTSRAAQISG